MKDLYFLPCMHMFVWGECCSLKQKCQNLYNILYSRNRILQFDTLMWILSGANLIKVMKIKFQFYRLNQPNCALWINSLDGRDDFHRPLFPWSNTEGNSFIQSALLNLHTWHSKQMPSVPVVGLCERRHFKCKVQFRACSRAQENFEI